MLRTAARQRATAVEGMWESEQMVDVAELPASPFRPDVLAGQVAFVTGGGTGIGKEICRVLGHHGARIAIASRKREVLDAAAAELACGGDRGPRRLVRRARRGGRPRRRRRDRRALRPARHRREQRGGQLPRRRSPRSRPTASSPSSTSTCSVATTSRRPRSTRGWGSTAATSSTSRRRSSSRARRCRPTSRRQRRASTR